MCLFKTNMKILWMQMPLIRRFPSRRIPRAYIPLTASLSRNPHHCSLASLKVKLRQVSRNFTRQHSPVGGEVPSGPVCVHSCACAHSLTGGDVCAELLTHHVPSPMLSMFHLLSDSTLTITLGTSIFKNLFYR